MVDSTWFQEGSILTFIEIYKDDQGSSWAVSEDDENTKYIIRNTLSCGGKIGKILKVKVTDEYLIEPELKRVKSRSEWGKKMEWNNIPPDDDRKYNLTP